jgi:hypothetical protein
MFVHIGKWINDYYPEDSYSIMTEISQKWIWEFFMNIKDTPPYYVKSDNYD